ncbi:hypothetical protein CHS0354_000592 [Potamilus streckersoni]|uniref:(d)CMP kinase n=1 Tax=Potamilus streckersoni TaxID=2493646 RepID=A0AAE0T841_9BIVA|nr:hypothetical protein CHS0354_000592 [Potamilus streckersoni]
MQQDIGSKKGVVMDGRDIGTVVFPNAELKIFMTANSEIRAKRRTAELDSKSNTKLHFTVKQIKHELENRDNQDITRKQSALMKAYDAIVIDTSHLTFNEQVDTILKLAKERILIRGCVTFVDLGKACNQFFCVGGSIVRRLPLSN